MIPRWRFYRGGLDGKNLDATYPSQTENRVSSIDIKLSV